MTDRIGMKHVIGDTDFSIQRMYRKGKNAMKRPHSHSFYEIYYLLEGERVYFMNGKVTTVSKGEMMFINPEDLHSTASTEVAKFERILVNFSYDFVREGDPELASCLPLDQSQLFRFTVHEQAAIEHILLTMLAESESQSPYYVAYLRSLLIELLILIHRARMQHTTIEQPHDTHPMHHKISEIALYMNRNFDKPLTLEQMAKQFYISPSYLSRIFKKLTGFHFREYLQVIRIREAQRRLRDSKDSVQLISEQVGFDHIAHFNKTFKKLTDTTPLRYRKAVRFQKSER